MKEAALVPMVSVAGAGLGMFAIVWLAAHRLNGSEQGFFFAFLSFGALVQLADFGLSYASLQTAGRLAGTYRLGELPALARFVARWNVMVSTVATVAVAGIGWSAFSHSALPDAATPVAWGGPWLAYLLGILLSQWSAPGVSLREGSGKVAPMWRLRLAQEWTAAGVCVGALHLGGGLWSLAGYTATRAIVAAVWLRIGDPWPSSPGRPAFTLQRWKLEAWPFQWRIGLSGLSGFLVLRTFSPLILIEKGPVLAGQFGLAIAMMNLVLSISSAWPLSQTARYAKWSAEGRFLELDREFPIILVASTVLCFAGSLGLSLLLWQAHEYGLAFASRLTSPATTTIVLLAAVAHNAVACAAVFLRAEGREPLVIPSVLGGIVTTVTVWLTARFGEAMDIAAANLLLAVAWIPVAFLLVRLRRRQRLAKHESSL